MDRLEGLKAAVGQGGYLDDPDAMAPYLEEWRGRYRSETPLVLLPATTAEVAAVVAECAEQGIGIVAQGGNTGLCGGAVAGEDGLQVILSLRRLNRIRQLSTAGDFLIAEAGCVLADLQAAAEEAGRLFALSLAAEGSCQIGGNLATDAGGINVLRYGTARQQVLGLEVVLADGRVWNGLRTLRKNTAGYDLRDLFIGAEGTLGIITAAALRLHPRPADVATAMIAIDGPGAAVALLEFMRGRLGEEISAFELVSARALEFVLRHIADTRHPFDEDSPAYVLMESTANRAGDAAPRLEAALEAALEEGLLRDAVSAGDGRRRDALWRLRHNISEAQRSEGVSLKHDISLPVERIDEFLQRIEALLARHFPDARPVVFGHVGDGNLHFNLSQPAGGDAESFRALEPRVNEMVFDTVQDCGGSFSAEHGVGLLRREQMRRYLDDTELDLMRRLKTALDPDGILNPGKVL